MSWAKAGKDSRGRNKATRSEGDDLGDSAARALTRHGGRGRAKAGKNSKGRNVGFISCQTAM